MSTTSEQQPQVQAHRRHVLRAEIDAADVFDAAVWDTAEVCNRCFQRIRRVEEYHPAVGVSEYAPTSHTRRAVAGVAGRHPDHLPTKRAQTYCEDCGSEHGRGEDDPLSKQEARVRCDALADRVEDAGLKIDRGALRYVVRRLKSHPELSGADTEIARRATKLAVRHADP